MQIKSALLGALLSLAFSGAAQASLINFEDAGLPGEATATATWDGVAQGFNSSGFHFSNADVLDLSGTVPWWTTGVGSAHSGNYAGFNDWNGAITLSKVGGGTFSIQDFWTAGWQGASGTLTITGLLNDQTVDSEVVSYNGTWQDVVLNFSQVDRVVFSGGLFFVDDITVNGSTQIPEPASVLLLGLGLAYLAASRRKNA